MESQDSGGAGSRGGPEREEPGYDYRPAGIRERDGSVPSWLIFVIVGLSIWAVYYVVVYWAPPGP